MSTSVSAPSTFTDAIPRFGPVEANRRTTDPSKLTVSDAPAATVVVDEPAERAADDDSHQPVGENTNPGSMFSPNRRKQGGAMTFSGFDGVDVEVGAG